MELIYRTKSARKHPKDWVHDESPLCALSPRNIIAFTSNEYPEEPLNSEKQSVYFVYVCDIDKPWDRYLITTSVEHITCLVWDNTGTRLLLTTSQGTVQIWTMVDYLLNDWNCSYSTSVEGEHIVSATWLHTGIKHDFMADNKDGVSYAEKIQRAKYVPTLSHFGGRATEGVVFVVASGLVFVSLIRATETELLLRSESLCAWRSRILVADITHCSNGDLMIAASDGAVAAAIQVTRVTLKTEPGACKIQCKPVSSLYPKCHLEYSVRECSAARVTHLVFVPSEGGEVLVVAAGDSQASHVELWNLTRHNLGLHPFFQTPTADLTQHTTQWVHKASVMHSSMPQSVAIPRLPVTYKLTEPTTGFFQYVAVSYKDGSVKLINRWNFQRLSTTNMDAAGVAADPAQVRKRATPCLVCMQQSISGCVLVGLDQIGSLYGMRAANTRDPLTALSPPYIVNLLEYGIVVGHDWWDVMAAIKPALIETVIGKLSDNFVKQPSPMQELLYSRFMAVKSWLYRVSAAGQQRAADCHCQIMLHSLSTAFKSMLRPKTTGKMDLSPAERLSNGCAKSVELDLDKTVSALCGERAEFHVDMATLSALPMLMGWACELATVLLAQLPLLNAHSNFPGVGLVHDAGALSLLREILVLVRCWGRTGGGQPLLISTIPSQDPLPLVFRLITRVWLLRRDGTPIENDESLLDECCTLPSKMSIPPADHGLFGDLSYDTALFFQPQPLNYMFGEAPRHTKPRHVAVMPDGQSLPRQRKDIVRQVALGVAPNEPVRQCARCSCVSLLRGLSTVAALKAWDLRWARACPCGGPWKVLHPRRDALRTRGLSVLLP